MVCERASEKHAMFGSVGIESGSSLWRYSLGDILESGSSPFTFEMERIQLMVEILFKMIYAKKCATS